MPLQMNSSIVAVVISAERLDEICEEAFQSMLEVPDERDPEPGDLWKAARILSDYQSRSVSRARGAYTKFGNCLQNIVCLVAKENGRFDVFDEKKPTKKITDITIVANDATYLLFVQSQYNTKNSGAMDEINGKIQKKSSAKGIIAVVQDYPPKLDHLSRKQDKAPNVTWLVGPELFKFLSDGDATLYSRLRDAIKRWRKTNACKFQ